MVAGPKRREARRLLPLKVVAAAVLSLASVVARGEAGFATVLVQPSAMTPDVVRYVAAVGAPALVSIEPEDSLNEVVRRHCGYLNTEYIALLRERDVPGTENPDAPLGVTVFNALQLPACLSLSPTPAVRRSPRIPNFPWGSSRIAPPMMSGVNMSVPEIRCGQNCSPGARMVLNDVRPLSLETSLGIEEAVDETSATWTSLRLADPTSDAEETIERLFQLLERGGQADELLLDETPEELELYSNLSARALAEWEDCISTDPSARYEPAFDEKKITLLLMRAVRRLRAQDRSARETWVAIPDTGLPTGMPSGFFRYVDRSSAVFTYPTADSRFAERHHGSHVASIAVGGPFLAEVLAGLQIRLEVAPLNVFAERRPFSPKPERLNEAIRTARHRGGVVNLSVGKQREIVGVTSEIGFDTGGNLLFVVAAGNDGKRLGDTTSVYPAMNGGNVAPTVITVGALDLDGSLAGFSNRGATYVDIAAPGCLLPVFQLDEESGELVEIAASGTSFAAPLVSFTGAVLRSIWPRALASQIKRRILVSADIHSALDPEDIEDQRRLNVEKALGIDRDIVDAIVDDRRIRIHGRLELGPEPVSLCEGKLSLFLRSPGLPGRIRKIARTAPNQFLVYWEGSDGRLQSRRCQMSQLPVKITDELQREHHLELGSILDIVTAEPDSDLL